MRKYNMINYTTILQKTECIITKNHNKEIYMMFVAQWGVNWFAFRSHSRVACPYCNQNNSGWSCLFLLKWGNKSFVHLQKQDLRKTSLDIRKPDAFILSVITWSVSHTHCVPCMSCLCKLHYICRHYPVCTAHGSASYNN